MKFNDLFEFGVADLKKHKLRFAMNTFSIALILTVIFFLLAVAASITTTVDSDLEQYLTEHNNTISIELQGTEYERSKYSVTTEEADTLHSFLSEYGEVKVKEYIRVNNIEIEIGAFHDRLPVTIVESGADITVLSGQQWSKELDATNSLWLTEDIYRALSNIILNLSIGDEVKLKVNEEDVTLRLLGIAGGSNNVFVCKTFCIDHGIAYRDHVNYQVSLQSENLKTLKKLEKDIDIVANAMVKYEEHPDRVTNYEITHLRNIYFFVGLCSVGIAAIVLYLSVLILGILKNNAVINIFDNIKTFSMMRCIGLDNKKLVGISMVETTLGIVIGSLLGGCLSLALSKCAGILANRLLAKELLDQTVIGAGIAWWPLLCYFAALFLSTLTYFSFTLTKSLKRQKLLQTLKRE